jgi:hypothetical protein
MKIINLILKHFLRFAFSVPLIIYLVFLGVFYWEWKYIDKFFVMMDEIGEDPI